MEWWGGVWVVRCHKEGECEKAINSDRHRWCNITNNGVECGLIDGERRRCVVQRGEGICLDLMWWCGGAAEIQRCLSSSRSARVFSSAARVSLIDGMLVWRGMNGAVRRALDPDL